MKSSKLPQFDADAALAVAVGVPKQHTILSAMEAVMSGETIAPTKPAPEPTGSPRPWRLTGDPFRGYGVAAADGSIIIENNTLPYLDAMRIRDGANCLDQLEALCDGYRQALKTEKVLRASDVSALRAALALMLTDELPTDPIARKCSEGKRAIARAALKGNESR